MYVKITNRSSVFLLWACCLLISMAAAVMMIIGSLIFPEHLDIIAVLGFFLFGIIFLILLGVDVFDFENSGEVIVIRNYGILNHLFTSRYHRKLELPRDKILAFEIKRTVIKKYLKVKIERYDGTRMIVFFSIPYLSDTDILQLTESAGHK